MIDFYTFATPNCWKVSVLLEELGLPYTPHVVDITKGEQFSDAFGAISPHNKVPLIVDPDGPGGKPITVAESTAILIYLARKAGSCLLPADERGFTTAMQWLSFQTGGIAPMVGQMSFFVRFSPEKIPFAIERYTRESKRILAVMEKQLGTVSWLAGPDYSIADIAAYGWIVAATRVLDLEPEWPKVARWLAAVGARPAVIRGMAVPPIVHA